MSEIRKKPEYQTQNWKREMRNSESLIPNLTCRAMEWQRGERKSNTDGLIAVSDPVKKRGGLRPGRSNLRSDPFPLSGPAKVTCNIGLQQPPMPSAKAPGV